MTEETFFERTKRLCKENNTTIEGLMVSCGLTKDAFMKWRRRSVFPRADVLYKMSRFFHVSMEYLLNGVELKLNKREDRVYSYLKENMPGLLQDIIEKVEKNDGSSGIKVS